MHDIYSNINNLIIKEFFLQYLIILVLLIKLTKS